MSAVAERVAQLDALDVGGLDRAGVQAAMASLVSVRGWHDGLHVRLSRRLAQLAECSPSIFPEADIAAASKTSRRAAGVAARRANTLDDLPGLEAALDSGECSAEHVDALGRALGRLHGGQRDQLSGQGSRLAELAARTSPEEFERALRREVARLDPAEAGQRAARQRRAARFRSWTDRDTGMVCFRGELDPDTGLKVISRIDATVEALFHCRVPDDCPDGEAKQDFLRAAAFTRLVLRRNASRSATNGNIPSATDGSDVTGSGLPHTSAAVPGACAPDVADCDATDTDVANADVANVDVANVDVANADVANADVGDFDAADADMGEIDVLDNRCEMLVVIDLETLLHGLHERSIIDNGHDVDLPLEAYRRMACTAAIVPVVLDSAGVCVDEGREVRLATRKQRRALRAMYDTCGIPGCTVRSRHCEPHHIRWWRHWGRTDLNNLLPLCSRHHHAVHEGGWQLVMHPDRSLTITYPDGTVHATGPPRRKRVAA